jgi:hypothetical protein
MAYARKGEGGSDVHVYRSSRGLVCCGRTITSTEAMVTHLEEHMDNNDNVPWDVIPNLRADDAENFPKGQRS